MRVKGSEWNALLKEGNTGWRRSAALWIITGVAPGAACSRSSSPQRGHRKAAQCTSQCNRHCTKYNKKHQLNEPLKIYYSMMQSNTIYPMFQSGNIFCAVHVKLPQSVYYLYLSVLVSSSMRGISVQFGLTNWIGRHDFCWFTCLRFGYFCICIITLLCDSAFKHMLISSFLHCKVERCLTSLWFCVILYLFLLYFCIYVFVYFSILVDCIGGWSGDKVEQPGGFLSSSIVSQDRLIITKSPALDCFLLNMWGGGGWWW